MTIFAIQWTYLALAVSFNLASLAVISRGCGGAPGLTPNNPRHALVLLAVFGLALLAGHAGMTAVYRLLMAGFVVVLGGTGIVGHLLRARDLTGYRGRSAWLAAIAINVFGVAGCLAAAVG